MAYMWVPELAVELIFSIKLVQPPHHTRKHCREEENQTPYFPTWLMSGMMMSCGRSVCVGRRSCTNRATEMVGGAQCLHPRTRGMHGNGRQIWPVRKRWIAWCPCSPASWPRVHTASFRWGSHDGEICKFWKETSSDGRVRVNHRKLVNGVSL